ncbi:unnamed protein product [Rotaria magnacalcarata]|uniref:HTTM domain-containing protein n=2 Tax=Rotaria magnacalcarata TaxID=392030 RepID=A0A819H1Q1_9BILA|nr:unnamed protein product [Rotaria magnacalcarata]CAF3894769.1 unnamed protein product [Rotaria magnacalcarata]
MSNHSDDFNQKLVAFWCDDLPPMNDGLRILFYGGLLLIAVFAPVVRPHLGDSPLQAPELYSYTLPEFFTMEGCMKAFGKTWMTNKRLRLIRSVCMIAWIGCIIGVGGIWSPIVVSICMLMLHGVVVGCVGTNHRWYAPVYTMLALALSNGNGVYSVDHYFSSRYNSYPFSKLNNPALFTSGFGRKVTLVSVIMTLFFGGITKMLNSGLKWMDGSTIGYYVNEENKGRWPWLKIWISKCQPLLVFLSVKTMILELSSPCALFVPFFRPILLVSASIFHFGIWLTLHPNYLPQTWCYILCTNYHESMKYHTPVNLVTLTASWGITVFLAFSIVCALMGMENWPFTSIPMYSYYRDTSYSHMYLENTKQARCVSHECINSGGYPIGWSSKWIYLWLSDSAGNLFELDDLIVQNRAERGVLLKQWVRMKNRIAARDIMAKSDLELLNFDSCKSKQHPAQTWLIEYANIWRLQNWSLPAWTNHEDVKLQFGVRLKNNSSIALAFTSWMTKRNRED